jgi:exonuclease III
MNPNRREFTYVPRDRSKENRSRIDFMLISWSLAADISSAYIAKELQNALFDHKAVFTCFNDFKRAKSNIKKGISMTNYLMTIGLT